ncbi:MAG: polysaccharide deacetylase family protein [Burkholderiales bacterium]|nr:polysaccharide deacetylase family protein [Burkholderiales bacterium]
MLRLPLTLLSPAGARARLSILFFHRVLAQRDEIFPGEVDGSYFDAICTWVKASFNVLPLDEAARCLRHGVLPARALAITFDDGYRDNHAQALPILQRHGLTATFYIATGYLDGGRMFNDTVVEAIRRSPLQRVDLHSLAIKDLTEVDIATPAQRRQLIELLLEAIKFRSLGERGDLGHRLAELTGATLPDDLMMSSAQVRELRAAGMQIGAHTVNHPILAKLPRAEAAAEICTSKRTLEELIGERVGLFAYPNGKPGRDFSDESVALVREAGFDCATTTVPGAARAGTDPFRLPRFSPWERTHTRFALRAVGNLLGNV